MKHLLTVLPQRRNPINHREMLAYQFKAIWCQLRCQEPRFASIKVTWPSRGDVMGQQGWQRHSLPPPPPHSPHALSCSTPSFHQSERTTSIAQVQEMDIQDLIVRWRSHTLMGSPTQLILFFVCFFFFAWDIFLVSLRTGNTSSSSIFSSSSASFTARLGHLDRVQDTHLALFKQTNPRPLSWMTN